MGNHGGAEDGGIAKTSRETNWWRRCCAKANVSLQIHHSKLHEFCLTAAAVEIYDEPDQEQDDDNLAADDRIAEQFRRDFMDAIQSRRTRGGQPKPATKVGKVEAPKGPKLGGSRSARAAMREQQEKAAKK